MKSNRFFYISILIASLVFVYFYGGRIPYALFYFVAITPVLSLISMLAGYLLFAYSCEAERSVIIKGDSVVISVALKNRSFMFFPNIKVNYYSPELFPGGGRQSKSLSMAPFSKKSISFETVFPYRGNYEITIGPIEMHDLLGMVKFTKRKKTAISIIVNPRIIKLGRLLNRDDSPGEPQFPSARHPEDMLMVSDVRKYAAGDSLKKIHWKLTAKTSSLMVKNFQKASGKQAAIILDLAQNPWPPELNIILEDKLVEATAAASSYYLSKDIPVRFIYGTNEMKMIEARGQRDFDQIYNMLSAAEFNSRVKAGSLAESYFKGSRSYPDLVIFTSNINRELLDHLHSYRRSGHNLFIVYVSPSDKSGMRSNPEDSLLFSLSEAGIPVCVIGLNEEIHEALENKAFWHGGI